MNRQSDQRKPEHSYSADSATAARLLSGQDRLSIIEKEQILQAVLQAKPVGERSLPWGLTMRLGAATAGLLLVVWMAWFIADPAPGAFTSRGTSDRGSFALACLGQGSGLHCQRGDRLLFRVSPPAGKPFFSAIANRPDGVTLWYFPSDEGQSVPIDQNNFQGVLSVGVAMGEDHLHGRIEVLGLFSAMPLNKAQIRARVLSAPAANDEEIVLVRRHFVLSEKP